MDPICSECKQKAEFICFCNDSHLCKACREAHKKKFKGPHKIILGNDPELDNIRITFKSPKGKVEKQEEQKKKLEDAPALVEEKKMLKEKVRNEIMRVEEFKTRLVNNVTNHATGLVKAVVSKYSGCLEDFNDACRVKEKALNDALEHLNGNQDISGNSLLCKLLDFPDLDSASLLDIKAVVREEVVSIQPNLTLKVELVKSEENNQILDYYTLNKDSILPPLKVLFEDILNERHFSMTSIKLPKISLAREALTQFSLLLPSFSGIKVLQLTENDLGLDGIKKISPILPKMTNLRKLAITKNVLKGPGGKFLAQFLKDLKELINLDLSGNKLASEGCKHVCLALQNLSKLKSLKLMNNGLGNDSAGFIISCLPSLKKLAQLRLTGNSINSEQQGLIEEHAPNKCDIKF
jgi:hypothetical protein